MAEYTLQRDEVVILKDLLAGYGPKTLNLSRYELVLTNQKLILLKKNSALGGLASAKEDRTFPIDQIKMFNGQPQVVLIGRTELEIQFVSGPESFRFHVNKAAAKWVEQIHLLATGRESEVALSNERAGVVGVSDIAKETFGTLMGRSGAKLPTSEPLMRVAGTCNQCGAPIEGFKDRVATCTYCGTAQRVGVPTPSGPPAAPTAGYGAPPPANPVPYSPAPVAASHLDPGWKRDPNGAHEFRWWDGSAWSAHVSNAGVTWHDPL